jgi:large subunit ribosomal protein L18
VLKKLRGTGERPRLVVRRSLRHIQAQLVDDERGICLTGISTRSDEVKGKLSKEHHKTAQSHAAGIVIAERARAKGIERVVFDRGGYRYHGRVKAFAEGARKGGLKF